ncbi:MAG: FUSC family protein [Actinomycetia bacterium]|nr:FUSC family protein [Actinomycetes bacterium]
MIAEIFAVDWEQVRFKRALSGLIAMLLTIAFLGSSSDAVMTVSFATLFTIASGGDGLMTERWLHMLRFALLGGLIGALAFWSVDTAWSVALVLGLATYLGTLAAAFGQRSARAGLFLTIWTLFAVLLGSTETEPLSVSLSFLVGGVIAIVVTWIRLSVSSEDDADDEASGVVESSADDEIAGSVFVRFSAAARTPLGWFALVRTVSVVGSVLLGFWWFSSFPLWAAITVIIVVKPSTSQTASVAVQRTLGTAVGASIAIAIAQRLPESDTAVAVAFLISAVLMIAFMNANYTLFAVFLTATLVFSQRLAQADAFEAGWERVLATALGGLISFGAVWYAMYSASRRGARSPS